MDVIARLRHVFSLDRPLVESAAFALFYEQTHAIVFRYVYMLHGGPQADAEDSTAEAFTRAWNHRHRFTGSHGSQVTYVGQVICRQRPQTASGVTFFTLEDETGFVNLVLWVRVFEAHRALARTAPLLGVRGRIEEAEGVRHLIAESLFHPENLPHSAPRSRDFH